MESVLRDPWALWSVILVIVFLGLNLLLTAVMGELHRKRIRYIDSDKNRWESEFESAAGDASPWPYTSGIETLGVVMRWCKTLLPFSAGCLFVVGLLRYAGVVH